MAKHVMKKHASSKQGTQLRKQAAEAAKAKAAKMKAKGVKKSAKGPPEIKAMGVVLPKFLAQAVRRKKKPWGKQAAGGDAAAEAPSASQEKKAPPRTVRDIFNEFLEGCKVEMPSNVGGHDWDEIVDTFAACCDQSGWKNVDLEPRLVTTRPTSGSVPSIHFADVQPPWGVLAGLEEYAKTLGQSSCNTFEKQILGACCSFFKKWVKKHGYHSYRTFRGQWPELQ